MTEKEFKETVINDDMIKAVASGVVACCDAIISIAQHTKEAAQNGNMNDLIIQRLIQRIVEGETNDD